MSKKFGDFKLSLKEKVTQEINFRKSQQHDTVSNLGANTDEYLKPNPRFKTYCDIFQNLTEQKTIKTKYPISSCAITYNSKMAITVSQKSEGEYFIKMYCLKHGDINFEEKIGKSSDGYIKVKEVEQNDKGDFFAVAYMDDGKFRLRTFGTEKAKRTEEEIAANELDINKELDLDDHTLPIYSLHDPFICCTFVSNEWIFVNLFHGASLTHHHFFFNHLTRELKGKTSLKLEDSNN